MAENQQSSLGQDDLREVKLAFIEAHERGERVDTWLARYPRHARQLIDLAMALDSAATATSDDMAMAERSLRNAFAQGTRVAPETMAVSSIMQRVRARGLRLNAAARHLRLTPEVVLMLDQGFIAAASIPHRLLQEIAGLLDTTADIVASWVPVAPRVATSRYYADQAPDPPRQQTFAAVVAMAQGLSDADRAFWSSVIGAEGLPT